MLSRRLLRVKVLQIFYAHNMVEGKTYELSENHLLHSIRKSYELFHYLFLLIIVIRDYALERIAVARQKKIPSHKDLNPNTRFIDNQLIKKLEENRAVQNCLKRYRTGWTEHPELIKNLYKTIIQTEMYDRYMAEVSADFEADKMIVLKIYLEVVMNCEELYHHLEEESIYWLYEIDFVIRMIVKTIRGIRPENSPSEILIPAGEDDEDIEYSKLLLRKAIIAQEEYMKYIEWAVKNWDLDRIAEIDRLIMILAITEAVEFENIPSKVTMNEFIEIAKHFSTGKSSQFINGILDNIFDKLRKEKRIIKTGRGLIGENNC